MTHRIAPTLGCLALAACFDAGARERAAEALATASLPPPIEDLVLEPVPPFAEGMFPCSDCHDPELPVNTTPRVLTMAHDDVVWQHYSSAGWCLDCHDPGDRDRLHFADGTGLSFEESHRLCGQCHGVEHRDWRAGVHGKRSGSWNGEATLLRCAHCHDAHSPRYASLEPMPAPQPPRRTR